MSTKEVNQTIVIRRPKKHGKHAQHGGWKVAFADLMVALMCLFLVLWILQILDSADKHKIIQYFKDGKTAPEVHGYGLGNTVSPMVLPHVATSQNDADLPRVEHRSIIKGEFNSQQQLVLLAKKISDKVADLDASSSIKVSVMPQGVKLIIADSEAGPMFYRSSSRITPYYQDLLLNLAQELKSIENEMIITGHTDASQFVGSRVTNWELSSNRANVARYFLQEGGIPQSHIFQVSGMADTAPLNDVAADSPENRRVELFILTRKARESLNEVYKSAPTPPQEALDEKVEAAASQAQFNQPVTEFDVIRRSRDE